MGLFDKWANKAKEAAENAKKSADEALDKASKKATELSDKALTTAQDLSDKVSKTAQEFSGKASKDFAEFSKKASAEGRTLYDKAAEGISEFTENVGSSAKELSSWAEKMPDNLRKMADDFDAEALWDKLAKTAAKAGQELIVMVLTIYYAIESRIPGLKKPDK